MLLWECSTPGVVSIGEQQGCGDRREKPDKGRSFEFRSGWPEVPFDRGDRYYDLISSLKIMTDNLAPTLRF